MDEFDISDEEISADDIVTAAMAAATDVFIALEIMKRSHDDYEWSDSYGDSEIDDPETDYDFDAYFDPEIYVDPEIDDDYGANVDPEIGGNSEVDEFPKVDDNLEKFPMPKTSGDWKERGNVLYKSKNLACAKEAYFLGLKLCETKNDIWKLLKLNLAAVQLELGYFETTISICQDVLTIFQEEKKALMRAGKAHYRLRQFAKAFKYFKIVEQLFPDDVEGKSEVKKTITRIEETNGVFDFDRLSAESAADPLRKLDCADFVGPLSIVYDCIPGGPIHRKVVMTRNVSSGTLLGVSKAFAVAWEPLEPADFDVSTEIDQLSCGSVAVIISNIARASTKNPNTIGFKIYSLAVEEIKNSKMKPIPAPICDFEMIKAFCMRKRFYVNDSIASIPRFDDDNIEPRTGLFSFPSFINHSCVPNVFVRYFNDVMIMYSSFELKVGDEIFMSYISPSISFQKRTELLKQRGIVCNCIRCKRKA